MATTVEELRTVMRMELSKYDKDLQRLYGANNAAAKNVERTWQQTNKKLDSMGQSMARNITAPLAGIGAALATREVLAYADAWTSAKNSLAVAGVTGKEQAVVLDQLFASAQKNAAPIGAMADLFGKAAQASDNLGASQQQLLEFSDGVGVALRVAGTSAGAASGALTQLGQLLGQARVQAEEFNSINEGARPILMAVANGLDEAGGSVSKLKQLVNDGKVSGQQFFQAFLKGLPSIQSMAANSTQTIDQGITKVQNALTKYIGETDSSLGASQRLVAGLNTLADNFDQVADVALKVASIVAAGLLGRSIVGMAKTLLTGAAAAKDFAVALGRIRTIGALGTAFGGLGAAAGPVGALIGTVVVGALVAFDAMAEEAGQGADDFAERVKKIGEAAKQSAAEVEKSAGRMSEALKNRLQKEAEASETALDDARKAVDKFFARLVINANTAGFGFTADQAKAVSALSSEFRVGSKTADEIKNSLYALANSNPKFQSIADAFAPLLDRLTQVSDAARDVKDELESAGASKVPSFRESENASMQSYYKTQKFLDERTAESLQTSLEKDLNTRTKAILDAAEKTGEVISEAAARIQARTELDNEQSVKLNEAAVGGAVDLLKKFEGFQSQAYADWTIRNGQRVNSGYRAGYGSDTVTLADNSVQKITQGMSVSVADANRDLVRRIGEFQNGIRSKIGASTFDAMDSGQQAALTSIAYNYGSLPDRIVAAIKSGSEEQVYNSIKGLGSDNGGINRTRRNQEAEIYLSGSSTVAQTNVDFEKTLEARRQNIAALNEETAAQGRLNPLVNDYGYAMAYAREKQNLMNEAQQAGIEVTPELAATFDKLAASYATAEAARAKLEEGQAKLANSISDFKSTAKDITSGFISDLRNGKSAAEALAGALDKVADKLIDMALNNIFGTGFGGGSGILGAIGGIFGLKLASGGSVRGPGTGRSDSIPAMLSNGEFVVNAKSAKQFAPLLEAINSGKGLRFADGGIVGAMAPRLPDIRSAVRQSSSQGVHVTVGVSADNNGNLLPFVESVSQRQAGRAVGQYDTVLTKALPGRINDAMERNG